MDHNSIHGHRHLAWSESLEIVMSLKWLSLSVHKGVTHTHTLRVIQIILLLYSTNFARIDSAMARVDQIAEVPAGSAASGAEPPGSGPELSRRSAPSIERGSPRGLRPGVVATVRLTSDHRGAPEPEVPRPTTPRPRRAARRQRGTGA